MSDICAHAGWGMYPSEKGPCPPPAEMREIEGGIECPTCQHHVRTLPLTALFRETATLDRETR